ncbi:TonB-dependent receptor [Sphingobium subterraneum]|uniref:Outer membrane receptor protein involved in Fe transport n=1 Tax=Sphingobium subterraneum TaxID=627688 RepID=A0A841IX89_9SPHN|nr:TonB-dependent receptor [Sphingobium subterraneum]MBB6122984.1 outer membrane receptor protein involved in Fe transport [Sphingobium subterraneum]
MRNQLKLVLLATSAMTWSASAAHAQEGAAGAGSAAAPEATTEIADIVVTAQKRSERINDVGLTITAASGEQLKSLGISTPDDLIKAVPGFTYAKSAYGVPVYTMRGIGFYDYGLAASPAVTVYVDEVPLPYGSLTSFSMLDPQRVETIKGPQGILYGINSTAGAINIIPNAPTDQLSAGIDLGYARFNQVTTRAFVSGPLSDTLSARLSVQTDHGGAWQRSYSRGDKLGDKDIVSGRLLIDWKPAETVSLRLNVNAGIDRSDTQAVQYLGATPAAGGNNALRTLNPALYNYPQAARHNRSADWDANYPFKKDNHNFQAALTVNVDLTPDVQLKSITSYNRYTTKSAVDTDGTPFTANTILIDGYLRSFFQELRLSGQMDALRWIVGANLTDDKINERQDGIFTDGILGKTGYTHAAGRNFQTGSSESVYGNLEYKIGDGLTLQGGARYTNYRRELRGCTTAEDQSTANYFTARLPAPVAVGGCVTVLPDNVTLGYYNPVLKEDNLSWRAAANWKVDRNTLLYASVSHGYKSGAFGAVLSTTFASLVPAVQEDVLAYELGGKFTLLGGKVQFNTAAFYNDYTNKQVRGRTFDPRLANVAASALVNVPKSRIYGAEAQLTVRPVEGLTLSVDGTYIDTKITDSFVNFNFVGARVQMKGQVLPFSPKLTGTAQVDYDFAVSDNWRMKIGASLRHQSFSYGALGELPAAAIDSYQTLDLRASIHDEEDKWNFGVFGRNVTNSYYWSAPTLVIETVGRYAGEPVSYGVTVGYRF